MAGANPIRQDIHGAPFRIGNSVRVVRIVDGTESRRHIRRVGRVEYFEYECGCGQSFPRDPMIGVRFADGRLYEFWKDELQITKGRDIHGN